MKNFAGIPEEYATKKGAAIILQSIPYDGTSTWGKGADRGFEAFMDAAANMELYDIETDSEVYKLGIHMPQSLTDFDSPAQMVAATYERTKELLRLNKFLTFFGGEHSISIGVMRAFREHHEDLTILQLDAHADLRKTYEGTPYNHACALHEAGQLSNLVQVGIRSMDVTEKVYIDYDKIYFADKMQEGSAWMKASLEQMTDEVYVTLDLDVLDPSIMPATGTPEPGGMDWYQLINYLRLVFEQKNVVGFDLVELAPIDGLRSPQFLAAKLYYKMLSYKFFGV